MEILFEDNDVLLINKPAGLMVHSDGRNTEPTLVDWILEQYPSIAGIGEPLRRGDTAIDRPGIVHRLDRETSGALLLAKNQDSFLFFKSQFQNRTIQKKYHAFVWGHINNSPVTIDVPIGRNKGDFRKWHAGRGVRGETREAITILQTLHNFVDEQGEQFSFIEAHPKTGRTHQIRVHLKYIQRPIVCDSLYNESKPAALGFTRLALHAYQITFTLSSGEQKTVTAPYEPDFKATIAKYVPAC
ncbi:MAG TPA: RluA family pseudouridine synthase [Candidatus Paceibacterota bacterium]|nr:RluA family pseudouridine synthase [Candidatus Paceibacterota bacterium]